MHLDWRNTWADWRPAEQAWVRSSAHSAPEILALPQNNYIYMLVEALNASMALQPLQQPEACLVGRAAGLRKSMPEVVWFFWTAPIVNL
jgi:hypothetical protein